MSIDCNPLFLLLTTFLVVISRVLSETTHSDRELDQFVNLKNSGGIGCVLAVHNDVERCKSDYVQRMSGVIEAGNTMDSEQYRKAFCCGFWALRDCVADSAKQRCDRPTARTIANMKIYSTEQENVFYTKCDRFEYGSKLCGSASIQSISLWTLIVGSCIWALIGV